MSGGHTRYLPLTLRLRAKSTTQSYRTPVYYVDLTLREETNLTEAVRQAQEAAQRDQEAGLAIDQMEQAARDLLRNGQFEDIDEEVPMLLEEFYPQVEEGEHSTTEPALQTETRPRGTRARASPLTNKLGKGVTPAPGMS